MKITARGLWALVNINLFLFILSFSHSLPHQKKTLFIAHSYSFFTQHERITIIYSSEKASCSVGTERGLNETKAMFNISCMLHWISICHWAEQGQQNVYGPLSRNKEKMEKDEWNPIFQDTLHFTMKVYRMPDPCVLQRCRGNVFHFSIFARNS